jgi:hypothetical protein
MTEQYEAFCDASYYDMWCVRRIGERTFGQGFHVLNEKSALELKGELEALAARVAELEGWKAAEEAHHHMLRAENARLMNDLQAHKDALAQVEPRPPIDYDAAHLLMGGKEIRIEFDSRAEADKFFAELQSRSFAAIHTNGDDA